MNLLFFYSIIVAMSAGSIQRAYGGIVYVNATSTNTRNNCVSLQDIVRNRTLEDFPVCETLNDALGNVKCSRNCSVDVPLTNSLVILSDGEHVLTDCIGIMNGINVTIQAENTGRATVKCASVEQGFGNIVSCLSDGLVFRGINFKGCGPHHPNVFLNHSSNILFEDCLFSGNMGPPLQAQFVRSLYLLRTNFFHNIEQADKNENNTQNTTIIDLLTSITTSGGLTFFSHGVNVELTIDSCVFVNNTAEVAPRELEEPGILTSDGHGGAMLIRLSRLNNSRIKIINSVFDGNKAGVDGGGIFFSLYDNFSSSEILIKNNTFKNNVAIDSTGGAISYNIYSLTFNNSMMVEDCTFINNSGNGGGAVSVSLYASSSTNPELQDRVAFLNCKFEENLAKDEGTAVGLFALVGVEEFGFPVSFVDCSLEGNRHLVDSNRTPEHASALLAFRFPVTFSGSNTFSSNTGGGIMLLNTRMVVRGDLLLRNNSAVRGGGISMEDTCRIIIRPGVNLTFLSNSAILTGGGIHVSFPAIRYTTTIFNRLCFIQYSSQRTTDMPPHKWNATVTFADNHAGLSGGAIHVSDMQLCRWIGNEYSRNGSWNIFGSLPPEISPLSPFIYKNNSVGTQQENNNLATSPNRVFVEPKIQSTVVQSGEYISLDIQVLDEVGNYREAVVAMNSPNQNTILTGISGGNHSITFHVPSTKSLLGFNLCTNNSLDVLSINFSLPGTLTSTTQVTLEMNGCHPGYTMNMDTCTCTCDVNENSILQCHDNSRYVLLPNGVWGTSTMEPNGARRLITGFPPVNYLSCDNNGLGKQTGCLFMWDDGDIQCVKGRQGTFCGSCVTGYGISLDLQFCVDNSGNLCTWGLALFVILCVMVVILSFIIIFFNFRLPNELRGLLFYIQVVGLVFRPYLSLESLQDTNTTFVKVLTVIVNSMGFSVPIPLCISTSVQAQHVALLGYISPMLALTTVVVYVLCARCMKALSNRSSLSGITLLSLFVYKYVADTSFTLLNCSRLDNDWVFTYNGSTSCSSLDLVFVVIFALGVVIVFVGPAPVAIGYICIKRPQRFQQYADELSAGLRNKHRWFGGYDIGRRLPFIVFGFVAIQPSIALMLMILGALVILVVHMLVQPYEKNYINVIETLILMDLAAVGMVSLNPSDFHFPMWLLTVLLLAPFGYGIVFILCRIGIYVRKRLIKRNEEQSSSNVLTSTKDWLSFDKMQLWRHMTLFSNDQEESPLALKNRRRGSTVIHTDPTELDEFAEFRESLLDI